jgi:hypothetical protein
MKLFLATLSFVALIVVVNSITPATQEPSSGSLIVFGIASLITLKAIRRRKCQHQIHS